MPKIQLSKVGLEYFQSGQGPEKVVFVHGFMSSAPMWRLVQQALPSEQYSTIAINNRGAGNTDAPPDASDFSVQHFASDLFELVTALGWRDFTLVGHSLGGVTAPQFAIQHPELVKRLMLVNPADPVGVALPPGADLATTIDGLVANFRALISGSVSDAIDTTADLPADMLKDIERDVINAPERRLWGSLYSLFTARLGEKVGHLPMPVLMVGSDRDKLIPVADLLATWAKYPPGTGLHFWHGVGHSPNLDRPEEFAKVLRLFIETKTSGPS